MALNSESSNPGSCRSTGVTPPLERRVAVWAEHPEPAPGEASGHTGPPHPQPRQRLPFNLGEDRRSGSRGHSMAGLTPCIFLEAFPALCREVPSAVSVPPLGWGGFGARRPRSSVQMLQKPRPDCPAHTVAWVPPRPHRQVGEGGTQQLGGRPRPLTRVTRAPAPCPSSPRPPPQPRKAPQVRQPHPSPPLGAVPSSRPAPPRACPASAPIPSQHRMSTRMGLFTRVRRGAAGESCWAPEPRKKPRTHSLQSDP